MSGCQSSLGSPMGLPLPWTHSQTTGILWEEPWLQGGKGQGASQKLDLENSFQGGLSSCQGSPRPQATSLFASTQWASRPARGPWVRNKSWQAQLGRAPGNHRGRGPWSQLGPDVPNLVSLCLRAMAEPAAAIGCRKLGLPSYPPGNRPTPAELFPRGFLEVGLRGQRGLCQAAGRGGHRLGAQQDWSSQLPQSGV